MSKRCEQAFGSSPSAARRHRLYYMLCRRPLVILTYENLGNVEQMSELVPERRVHFILISKWTLEFEPKVKRLAQTHSGLRSRFPSHEITFLCNTPAELELMNRYGLPAVLCNQNAFLDERIYRIWPHTEKRYDAVYNGQIEPFKRHRLAKNVHRLALITYTLYYRPVEERRRYFEEIRSLLSEAVLLNRPGSPRLAECSFDPHLPRIAAGKVSEHLCQAEAGLILSAEEGACFASTEYLLSGLPVVSTRSRGGRDRFFEDECAEIVDETSEAVATGVAEVIRRRVPPEHIRESTLEKMRDERGRFIRLMNRIYRSEGVSRDFNDEWGDVFINKMMRVGAWPHDFLRELEGDG